MRNDCYGSLVETECCMHCDDVARCMDATENARVAREYLDEVVSKMRFLDHTVLPLFAGEIRLKFQEDGSWVWEVV